MTRRTGPDAATRQLVRERSGGICEVYGDAHATQIHHRQPRGMGGSRHRVEINRPPNLLDVCTSCHELIESQRTEAYRLGWLVRRPLQPREMRVWYRRRWVLLTDLGTVVDLEAVA